MTFVTIRKADAEVGSRISGQPAQTVALRVVAIVLHIHHVNVRTPNLSAAGVWCRLWRTTEVHERHPAAFRGSGMRTVLTSRALRGHGEGVSCISLLGDAAGAVQPASCCARSCSSHGAGSLLRTPLNSHQCFTRHKMQPATTCLNY